MQITQFVMAYEAEQDRLRAMMPEGFESLRPVLRINAEIREEKESGSRSAYIEFNTPVSAFGKRGWLNIANWQSPETEISVEISGKKTTFCSSFLTITYTGAGITGGCPAEKDNDGCFFKGDTEQQLNTGRQLNAEQLKDTRQPKNSRPTGFTFIPKEVIDSGREFCSCSFAWHFSENDACGASKDEKSLPAFSRPPAIEYKRRLLTAEAAAAIPCQQVLGSYAVTFARLQSKRL